MEGRTREMACTECRFVGNKDRRVWKDNKEIVLLLIKMK